jgi:hypothetical protein
MKNGAGRDPRMSPLRARLVLLVIAVLVVLGLVGASARPGSAGQGLPGGGADQTMFAETIARLHAGEPYYPVLGDELRRRGYPLVPMFNWRTPALFVTLALNPVVAHAGFVLIGVLILAVTVRLLSAEPLTVILAGAIFQAGAIGVIFDPAVWVFPEIWAGYGVALSAFAYGRRWWCTGAVLGVIALFVRELAAPYALICGVLAWRSSRRRELAVWIAGLVLYAAYYGLHVRAVALHRQPTDLVQAVSWIQFGGMPFVLTTFGTNSLLHNRPIWLAALVFAFSAVGILSRELPVHIRGAVMIYLAAFAIAGQPFNWYWGWLTGFMTPLVFASGVGMFPGLVAAGFLGSSTRDQAAAVPAGRGKISGETGYDD